MPAFLPIMAIGAIFAFIGTHASFSSLGKKEDESPPEKKGGRRKGD
jgi:hypothetical protein